eukprot:366410-Chlamydomonas_euryale.AAC.22
MQRQQQRAPRCAPRMHVHNCCVANVVMRGAALPAAGGGFVRGSVPHDAQNHAAIREMDPDAWAVAHSTCSMFAH